MTVFRKVREYFAFTRGEQKILFLLALVFLAGAGIKAYRSLTVPPVAPSFDYTQSDSVFAARTAAASPARADAKRTTLDMNAASRGQLIALPGIGPALADRILAYRAAHGRFRNVSDVKKIVGIGPKKYERLRGLIEVKPDTGR